MILYVQIPIHGGQMFSKMMTPIKNKQRQEHSKEVVPLVVGIHAVGDGFIV